MDGDQRFEILGALGKGGMGTVFRARDRETGGLVAIKELHPMFVDEGDYLARFEREVEVARRINSPHAVTVLGYGRRDGVPYMVMELVEGRSLHDLLAERGRLSWSEAKQIIIQVVEGLRAAHRVGVIHRDIKPSNILIARDGTVKLADFGIARATDMTRLTGGATMLGTPAYMAPENSPSAQSDLYALGCVLYEMLAGQPPFNGDSQQEILVKHLRERPDLTRVPEPSRRILASLLQKTPQRRPQSATALLMLLESDTPPAADPSTPAETLVEPGPASRRPATQSQAVILAGAAIGVLLLVAFLFAQQCGGSDGPAKAGAEGTATAEPTATVTPLPPTELPVPTQAPPPVPTSGPTVAASTLHVTESNWTPVNARFGDTITITITYNVGDAAVTKLQLHEVGQNTDGTPVQWGSIKNLEGVLVPWTGDNYLVTNWSAPASSKANKFTLTLNCNGPKRFTSKLFIAFIDAKDRRTESELSVSPVCG